MGKPNFSDEFKRDAVAQITERYPVAEASQRLGVSQHLLYAWKRQLARQVSGDAGKDAEIRQLKRELARVTEERDIPRAIDRVYRVPYPAYYRCDGHADHQGHCRGRTHAQHAGRNARHPVSRIRRQNLRGFVRELAGRAHLRALPGSCALRLLPDQDSRMRPELEAALKALQIGKGHDVRDLPKVRTKKLQVNTPDFEVRSTLYRVLGVDLTQIHGIGPSLALKLVGECGTDLAAWPSSKHFTSWLYLAPGNKIWGGKLLSSKTRRSSSRAAALLRLAATTIGRSDTALGAFYRRLSARAGKAKAVTATARKIAVLFYNSLRYGMAYHDPGATQYEERYRSRVIGNLQRRAKAFGFSLQELPPEPDMAVS